MSHKHMLREVSFEVLILHT